MKLSRGDKVFVGIMYVLAIICGLVCLLPVMNVFAKSLSSAKAVASNSVTFWPKEMNFAGWQYVWVYTSYKRTLLNSVINTVSGTSISLFVTIRILR